MIQGNIMKNPYSYHHMKPFIIFGVLAAFVVLVVSWFIFNSRVTDTPADAPTPTVPTVLSFEDCVRAGYPVMESNPRQCRTPDGRTYAEEVTEEQRDATITYENASANNIIAQTPRPGDVTGKTFVVSGQARGPWYFEASFPIHVLDKDGAIIATAVAQAQGDWMTENFVPFQATVTVPQSFIGEATLVFQRDNPSALPENDASMMFPIAIEY